MNLTDFHYELPAELVAQQPLADRAASRLLVLHKSEGRWEDRHFRDLPDYLQSGDCLVVNNSKVLPSRLYGKRTDCEGDVEALLLHPVPDGDNIWRALVRPGRRMRVGDHVIFSEHLRGEVLERLEYGERAIRLVCDVPILEEIQRIGHMPLPPYIKRDDAPDDKERYQTVYAKELGSAAAPTAGLHFTPEVLQAIEQKGVDRAEVTLHVGLGTFQPLRTTVVEEGKLHSEYFQIDPAQAEKIRDARRRIAVGTTSTRTLETVAATGDIRASHGHTDIFIYPGHRFQAVDAMITNFHLPQSSLLLLVSAFAGKDLILAAYQHAVKEKYRFFSYGDCMLILP